jgi:hypothetical protein
MLPTDENPTDLGIRKPRIGGCPNAASVSIVV